MSSRFLQQLRREQRLDSGASQQLFYLLDASAAHLRLELVVAKAQPNGRLDAPQPYRLQPAHLQQPPPFLDAGDVALLRQLTEADARWLHCSAGELPANAVWLEALIATGRARTREGTVATLGETLQLDCRWDVDKRGRQRLDWRRPPGIRILPATPPCYWDEFHARLGRLASDLASEALGWLEQRPQLAPDEVGAFVDEHGAAFSQWGLPLPREIAASDISPRAQPQLRLYRASAGTDPGSDRLRLQFSYDCGGEAVVFDHADPAESRELYHRERRELFTVHRDPRAEAAAERALYAALADYTPQPLAGAELTFADHRSWRAVMTEVVPALKQQGWHIATEPGFRHHFVKVDEVELAASWRERGWFELALNVDINGETVPLLPLLADCAKRYTREQLLALDEGTELPLTLPDGRRLLVAARRLAHWLAVLVEFDSEAPATDTLRLPASQLNRLNALAGDAMTPGAESGELLEQARQLETPPSLEDFRLPAEFRAELRGYQRLGVAWLQQRRQLGVGGILADDMGLGKTVQALAHLAIEHAAGRLQQPALVVAPTSVLHNWQQEAQRFAPQLRCAVLHGPQRHRLWQSPGEYDLLLTSYALVVRDIEQWRQQALSTVILDEAQAIKNARSQTARHLRQLQAPYKLCLTGTPLENHLGELWSQFEFLMPGFLDSEQRFQRQYRRPIENNRNQARAQALMQRIAPFILRRTKEDVAADLPPKTEVLVRLPLQDAQRDLYEMLRQHSVAQLQQRLAESDDNQGRVLILNALMQLRQACCDPQLVDAPDYRHANSAKREHLLDMLEELVDEGRSVLVFSQFTRMLALIAADLDRLGIDYLMLTGQSRNRAQLVEQFQAGKAPVFLVSLKAGGTGLNLTRADTVVHYDPWWNSAAEAQATDRAYRIGQDKPVFVYKLLAEDTVEEKIHALQQHKRNLLDQVYAVAEANTEQLALNNAALLELLKT